MNPPRYPNAQPRDDTASRSSGVAISHMIASYTTSDEPRQMCPMNSSSAPSAQRPSATNTMQHAAVAPTQANPAIQAFLRGDLSAIAPTTGSSSADISVAAVTT